MGDIKAVLDRQIFHSFGKYIPLARDAASSTAESWNTQPWSSYKATVRRSGVWNLNYNSQLWRPMDQKLTAGWERAFQRRLPNLLEDLGVKLTSLVEDYHKEAVAHVKEHCINPAGVTMLDQQLEGYRRQLKDVATVVKNVTQELQKEASRSFTPVIQEDMQPVYTTCFTERGK